MRKIRGDPSWYPMALAIGVPMRLRCTHWVKPSLAWPVQLFPCGYASFFLKDFFERKSGPACRIGPSLAHSPSTAWPPAPDGRPLAPARPPGTIAIAIAFPAAPAARAVPGFRRAWGRGQRWAHRAGAVADPCGARLHDGHRIALALVAQGDVGQEEVAHQALANKGNKALLAGFGQVMGPQQDALRAQALGFLCVADGQGGAAAGIGNDGGAATAVLDGHLHHGAKFLRRQREELAGATGCKRRRGPVGL